MRSSRAWVSHWSGSTWGAAVREYVLHHAPPAIRMRDIRAALPGVSDQTIRLVLRRMRADGRIAPDDETGGPETAWMRLDRPGPNHDS